MRRRRWAGLAVLGPVLLGAAGCDDGAPPSGSRAIVPADHLERQRVKLQRMRTGLRVRPISKLAPGR